ncbi:ABC-2 transporter permease [Sporosalibacterium faouarense]|uniref:ABC-2 transporter permease n=1 Tax=Sporosalibacterium faouarense TaxID=516123 RepID=UPI00192B5FB2
MLYIIFKEFSQSKKMILLSLIFGSLFIVALTSGTEENLMVGRFVLMIAFMVVMTNEHNEDKNKGYSLMRTLPLKQYKIVIGKFTASFILILLGGLYTFIIIKIKSMSTGLSTDMVTTIINSVSTTLLFIGIFYILLYKFGSGIAINISRVVFFIVFFSPGLMNIINEKFNFDIPFMSMITEINIFNSIVLFVVSIVFYQLCMLVSMKFFRNFQNV